MAGAFLTLDVVNDELTPALRRLLAFEEDGLDLTLGQIGEFLVRSTRDRASKQIDPSGNPWAPLSPRYQRRKDTLRPGVPKLKFDFHMLGDQLSHQTVAHELFVGTNAKYGARQQFGDKGQPARVWLGLSAEDETEALDIVADNLERILGDRSGASA